MWYPPHRGDSPKRPNVIPRQWILIKIHQWSWCRSAIPQKQVTSRLRCSLVKCWGLWIGSGFSLLHGVLGSMRKWDLSHAYECIHRWVVSRHFSYVDIASRTRFDHDILQPEWTQETFVTMGNSWCQRVWLVSTTLNLLPLQTLKRSDMQER